MEVAAFSVYVVRGGEQGEAEHETGIAERRNPNWAHPGGYSQRDALSWGVSYGWGNQSLDRSGSGCERGPSQVCCGVGSQVGGQ